MRLLVIEDEPGIAQFVQEGLEEEGFAVDLAYDGKAGFDLAMTNEYDLLIVDWMVPSISGIEVCRRIRKEGGTVPIIFLTARDSTDDIVFGLEAGADDYIRKPFAFAELLARIRARLRMGSAVTDSLEAGPLTLNPATHRVFCNNEELVLTPKEFSLLEFLLRNRDKVCTRSRIIEHVWDIHFDSDTSVIDVYVNFLRKKLDAASCRNLIRTIRGVGYVIRSSEHENLA